MMHVPRNEKIDRHDPRNSRAHVPKTTRKENVTPRWIRKNENVYRVAQIALKANSSNLWYLDSGCSRHMTGDKSFFETLAMEEGGSVTFGDGSKKRVSHEFSAPRTPQQNGVVERKNRVLQEMARVMLLSNNVPRNLWAKAVNTACYIGNQVFLRPGTRQTLYELWKGRKPNVSYFHTFGSKCHILNDRDQLGKFDAKSDEGIFIGYALNSRACIVFNLKTRTVMESSNVVIDDTRLKSSDHEEEVVDVMTFPWRRLWRLLMLGSLTLMKRTHNLLMELLS
ncbi:hypothetical protein LWI29_032791 [Acer saccharum]|uniref:Integrase catalytic domain-containing protein n=1 Tax=Acer saccharum TaxID=4024 RepID=A0AA39SP29_ACESA|nr:hypothetical protein LWI29_032791 [Acer saccharum]